MSKLHFFLFIGIFLSCSLSGQPAFDDDLGRRFLDPTATTHFEFPESLNRRATITTPPELPVRSMAEWEELEAITITWAKYKSTLAEIVHHAQQECKVYINCESKAEVKADLDFLQVEYGPNVIFLENQVFNSVWIRDYGPNCAYLNNVDSLIFVDWVYNRVERPDDDVLPSAIAEQIQVPLYETSEGNFHLTATGGNFMSDGMGSAFSSRLIIDENQDKEEKEIDQVMQEFLGINSYTKFEMLDFDSIHHIDMHMKLLDEERFIFGEYPEGEGDHDIIEANIEYLLATKKNAFGEPYEVIRIPMPPDFSEQYPSNLGNADFRTYTNALFINKMILVPTYQTLYDTTALRIWRETMPGYNVVGIRSNELIGAYGAIHCVTKEIGVRDPLRIVYQKIKDQANSQSTGYNLEAIIQHKSGIDKASLFYRSNGEVNYREIEMEFIDFQKDLYSATIPDFLDNGKVEYYVRATANSGKTINRPMPAPEAYYDFEINERSNSVNTLGDVFLQAAFPNPSSGLVCIPLELDQAIDGQLALYDIHGKLIQLIHDGTIEAGSSKIFAHVADCAAGMYMLRLTSMQDVYTQKLVVKK